MSSYNLEALERILGIPSGLARMYLVEELEKTVKFYHYVSKNKVDMLLPQLSKKKFNIGVKPKISLFGLEIGAEASQHENSDLASQTSNLIQKLQKENLLHTLSPSSTVIPNSFFFFAGNWRHGLYYFKGGVPNFWGGGDEYVIATSAIYFAWTTSGDKIIMLAGSPKNILGEKVAPDGVFLPGTGGVEDALRSLIESFRVDEVEQVLEAERGGESVTLPGVKTGDQPKYAGEYGNNRIPLPGFDDHYEGLTKAQFCLDHLDSFPEVGLESAFRVFTVLEAKTDNFLDDLREYSTAHVERLASYGDGFHDMLEAEKTKWSEALKAAEDSGLNRFRSVCFGSPIYTAREG